MSDEQEFGRAAVEAIDSLKRYLRAREDEDDAGFAVEIQNGALQILFEEQSGKFTIAPSAPTRQIWITALATSFKLDWDAAAHDFILPRTGEALIPLIERLIEECVQG